MPTYMAVSLGLCGADFLVNYQKRVKLICYVEVVVIIRSLFHTGNSTVQIVIKSSLANNAITG